MMCTVTNIMTNANQKVLLKTLMVHLQKLVLAVCFVEGAGAVMQGVVGRHVVPATLPTTAAVPLASDWFTSHNQVMAGFIISFFAYDLRVYKVGI